MHTHNCGCAFFCCCCVAFGVGQESKKPAMNPCATVGGIRKEPRISSDCLPQRIPVDPGGTVGGQSKKEVDGFPRGPKNKKGQPYKNFSASTSPQSVSFGLRGECRTVALGSPWNVERRPSVAPVEFTRDKEQWTAFLCSKGCGVIK